MRPRQPVYRERHLLRPTAEHRQRAQRWLPWLQRDDAAASQKLATLLRRPPAVWLSVLAGMPSTRWIALLHRHGDRGQHFRYGPTTAQATDLGRVIAGLQDDTWLQHRYCGPLNYTGQHRLEQQSTALHRLLSHCVAVRTEADLVFAVHVSGDPLWHLHHSSTLAPLDAQQALGRVVERLGVVMWTDQPDTEVLA